MNLGKQSARTLKSSAKYVITDLIFERAESLDQEVAELREALKYYADRGDWDYGHKAREVLAKWGPK